MNRSIILYLLAALLLVSCGYQGKSSSPSSQDEGKNNLPAHIRLISTTPIKDQGERTQLGIRHARYHRERTYHEG